MCKNIDAAIENISQLNVRVPKGTMMLISAINRDLTNLQKGLEGLQEGLQSIAADVTGIKAMMEGDKFREKAWLLDKMAERLTWKNIFCLIAAVGMVGMLVEKQFGFVTQLFERVF